MLKLKRHIYLTAEQRQQLLDITNKGKVALRTFKCSQILVLSESGYKDQASAERVWVQITTVERTRQKFVKHGLEAALTEQSRPGRKRKLDGKAEALLVATAGSDAPDGRQEWTMQLQLVDGISDETVRRTLKKSAQALVETAVVHCSGGG